MSATKKEKAAGGQSICAGRNSRWRDPSKTRATRNGHVPVLSPAAPFSGTVAPKMSYYPIPDFFSFNFCDGGLRWPVFVPGETNLLLSGPSCPSLPSNLFQAAHGNSRRSIGLSIFPVSFHIAAQSVWPRLAALVHYPMVQCCKLSFRV